MIRQDYIMRMIEQLAKVLSKIIFNKETKNYQEAIDNIEGAFNSILGLDCNLINALSAKDIISLLGISEDYTIINLKYIIIAKLLKEKAEIKNLNDNLNSINDYQKALGLYLEGILNNKNSDIDLSDYYLDVKEILKKIRKEIPEDIRFKLFKFYDLIGEYDKAEDELFYLKELKYYNIADEGIKFYRNLRKLSEIDLQKGNLSKKEVAEGLAIFAKNAIQPL